MELMNDTLQKPANVLKGKIVAVDGPAGAGKGTLCKMLAYHYRLKYLDTGTLYRTLAYKVALNGGDPASAEYALRAFEHFNYDFRHVGNNEFSVFLDDIDITPHIRTMGAGVNASKISQLPEVRERLKVFQVEYANLWKDRVGVILDGQDIGTVICPNADFKFFIDASQEVRADRRHKELIERGHPDSFDNILAGIKHRDDNDRNREHAPLRAADDAMLIDTSTMTASEVLQRASGVIVRTGINPSVPLTDI